MHGMVQRCPSFADSSYLLSACYHCSFTVCLQDAFPYQWFTGVIYLPSSAQRHSNRAVHGRSASDCRENLFPVEPYTDLCSCLEVCTTWNHQVSSDPKFMDNVSAHRRKCKENAENHHASKKQMEVIVFPTQRQLLATFTPQHFNTNSDQTEMFNHCVIQVHQVCLAQERVQWESKSQQETKAVWGRLWHQEE